MQTVAFTAADRELVAAAEAELRKNFVRHRHHVAAALRMQSGKVFTGMHIEATVGRISVCAEAVVLGKALGEERELDTIVAVRYVDADAREAIEIVAPCGMCRELITDYGPDAYVLVDVGGTIVKTRMLELLPQKYREAEE